MSKTISARVKADAADINADGMVNDGDFALFAAQYDIVVCADPAMPSDPSDPCSADLNRDGLVDDADFVIFALGYNAA